MFYTVTFIIEKNILELDTINTYFELLPKVHPASNSYTAMLYRRRGTNKVYIVLDW
jgi:hypothetical protein